MHLVHIRGWFIVPAGSQAGRQVGWQHSIRSQASRVGVCCSGSSGVSVWKGDHRDGTRLLRFDGRVEHQACCWAAWRLVSLAKYHPISVTRQVGVCCSGSPGVSRCGRATTGTAPARFRCVGKVVHQDKRHYRAQSLLFSL